MKTLLFYLIFFSFMVAYAGIINHIPRNYSRNKLIDSYPASECTGYSSYTASNARISTGQALTLASGYVITSCKFYLTKVGSPTANMTAKLYATTGTVGTDAVPIGAALATSNVIASSTLSTSHALIEFTFPTPYTASAGDYAIVCDFTPANDSDVIRIGINGTAATHSGNYISYKLAWSAASSIDTIFYLYGN